MDKPANSTGVATASTAGVCFWRQDDLGEDTLWETTCGQAFEFNDSGPAANGFAWCGYCGKSLVESRTSDDEPVTVHAREDTCSCGKPLVLNYVTGKLFKRCPACRKREQDVQKASQHRCHGLKGIGRI